MSLEDIFYPEEKNPITKFDNMMIKSAGKIGEIYQHLTGKSYKDLVKNSYNASAYGFMASIVCGHIPGLIFVIDAFEKKKKSNYMSPIEEEIKFETDGYSNKLPKLFRASSSILSATLLYRGFVQLNMSLNNGDNFLMNNYTFGDIVLGTSFIPYTFAEYLSKAEIPKPPEKTVWERSREKFQELFTPELLPGSASVMYKPNYFD